MKIDEYVAIWKRIHTRDNDALKHLGEDQMHTFAQRFADLTQRMEGAKSDAFTAMAVFNASATKRDNLVIEHRDDLKIGVWSVGDGYVVVSQITVGLDVTYYDKCGR